MWNTDPLIVVGVLVSLCVILGGFAVILAVALRVERERSNYWAMAHVRAGAKIVGLERQLAEARKNDARDPNTGQYVGMKPVPGRPGDVYLRRSLEDICVNPASYPPNR